MKTKTTMTPEQRKALEEMIDHRITLMGDYGTSSRGDEGYEASFDPEVLRSLVDLFHLDPSLKLRVDRAEKTS